MSDERIHELFSSIRSSKEAYSTAVFLNIGKCLDELRALSPIKAPGAFYRWVTENTKMCKTEIVESIRCYKVYAPLFSSTAEMEGITPSLLKTLLPEVAGKKPMAPDEVRSTLQGYKDLSISDLRKKLKEDKGGDIDRDKGKEDFCLHAEVVCKRCKKVLPGETDIVEKEKKENAFTGNEG